MKEDFPYGNWYIIIDDENREIINNWKIQQEYNDDLFEYPQYLAVRWKGDGIDHIPGNNVEISLNQFIKYVLRDESQLELDLYFEGKYNYVCKILDRYGVK